MLCTLSTGQIGVSAPLRSSSRQMTWLFRLYLPHNAVTSLFVFLLCLFMLSCAHWHCPYIAICQVICLCASKQQQAMFKGDHLTGDQSSQCCHVGLCLCLCLYFVFCVCVIMLSTWPVPHTGQQRCHVGNDRATAVQMGGGQQLLWTRWLETIFPPICTCLLPHFHHR